MGWITQSADKPLSDSGKFEIAVRALADSLNYGSDSSPFLGSGVDYAQSRPYIPGDPVKSIDWRVTARTGRVHVKEYEAPKRMPLWILLDTSASMCVSSRERSKYRIGAEIAAAVGLAAQERLSPIGLLGLGQRDIRLQPTLSRTLLMQTAQQLLRYRVDESTHFADQINRITPAMENRSMILVISDFHDPDAAQSLKRLAARHDCAALHLTDPAELGIRGHAFFRLREAETGAVFSGVSGTPWVDPVLLRQTLGGAGIDYLHLRTDQPVVSPLRHFLAKRAVLGRAVR